LKKYKITEIPFGEPNRKNEKPWASCKFEVLIWDTSEELRKHVKRYYGGLPERCAKAEALCMRDTKAKRILMCITKDSGVATVAHEVFHAILKYATGNKRQINKFVWEGLRLGAENPSVLLAEEWLADLSGMLVNDVLRAQQKYNGDA